MSKFVNLSSRWNLKKQFYHFSICFLLKTPFLLNFWQNIYPLTEVVDDRPVAERLKEAVCPLAGDAYDLQLAKKQSEVSQHFYFRFI